MSRQFTREFLIEVQKGLVSGHSMVHKFGRNSAVPNGSWAHISMTPFATANFRTTASTMRIKSGGNAADAHPSGSGARTVFINGIDSSFNETTEEVTCAGASASSATAASFWRVHRAYVGDCGTYTGNNTGNIVIEDSSSTADMLTIVAGEGQTQYAGWTVPAGYTGYLITAWGYVDGSKAADIRVFTREDIDTVSAPFTPKRLKLYFDGVLGEYKSNDVGSYVTLPAKTDIWMEANGGGAGTEVTGNMEILLVAD